MEEYIKELQQQIKGLENQLKTTEEDRDETKQMSQQLIIACMQVLDCNDLEKAKDIIKERLHKAVN